MADDMPAEMRAEIDEHLLWVGKCINQWAILESTLFDIFSIALGAPEDMAAICFWRTPTFSQRLDFTRELVLHKANGTDTVHAWKELLNTVGDGSKVRNAAAHLHLYRHTHVTAGPSGYTKISEDFAARKTQARMSRPGEKQQEVNIATLRSSVREAIDLHQRLTEMLRTL